MLLCQSISVSPPSLLCSPLLISLTPKDKETHCTMGHHLSPQEQLLETFHCLKISSQFFPPSLSLFIFLLPLYFFLVPLPSPSVPSFHYNASLHGSQSAISQVTLSLAQVHRYRSQHRDGAALYSISC